MGTTGGVSCSPPVKRIWSRREWPKGTRLSKWCSCLRSTAPTGPIVSGGMASPWIYRRVYAVVGYALLGGSKVGSVSKRRPPRSGTAVGTPIYCAVRNVNDSPDPTAHSGGRVRGGAAARPSRSGTRAGDVRAWGGPRGCRLACKREGLPRELRGPATCPLSSGPLSR
jgi:hypothetical protein